MATQNFPPHFFVDMHCHPSMKPYAKSFDHQQGIQSPDINSPSSLWHKDPPSLFDKIKNELVGLTNFSQSDGTSLISGRVTVVCLSFYPQEKGFFINKVGTGLISDALVGMATEFGLKRINYIQQLESYWEDLKNEMAFVKQQENKEISINGKKVKYKLSTSYADIEMAEKNSELGETMIIFIPTIEGCHIFDQQMNCYEDCQKYPSGIPDDNMDKMLSRVQQLRKEENGYIRPAFITFAHHFWNGLCGQARSLTGFVHDIMNQENGLRAGFTKAGELMVDALLQPLMDASGVKVPPIFIDVKHMSRSSREFYYTYRQNKYPYVPVIISHAGVTGLSAPGGKRITPAAQEGLFLEQDINFFDDELLQVESTGGIIGIQLDERRIGSPQAIREAKGNILRRDIYYSWAKLVWNQVRHIAEVLDINGHFAWGIQALGTDFDGIIDPINGYWTSKEIDILDDYLLKHAYNYLKEVKYPCPLTQDRNKAITPEQVVDRIMTGNALNFFSRFYK